MTLALEVKQEAAFASQTIEIASLTLFVQILHDSATAEQIIEQHSLTLEVRPIVEHLELYCVIDCCSLELLDSVPLPPILIDLVIESSAMQLLL